MTSRDLDGSFSHVKDGEKERADDKEMLLDNPDDVSACLRLSPTCSCVSERRVGLDHSQASLISCKLRQQCPELSDVSRSQCWDGKMDPEEPSTNSAAQLTQVRTLNSSQSSDSSFAQHCGDMEELTDANLHAPDSNMCITWLPMCSVRSRHTRGRISDPGFYEARECERFRCRRNALWDPTKMTMSQENRESIEREVERRKQSVTRKVSQYVLSVTQSSYEVDLI